MTQPQFGKRGLELRLAAESDITKPEHFGPGLFVKQFRSNVPSEAPTFTRLTGNTQAGLLAKWNSANPTERGFTTCGEFVGHFTSRLGLGWIGLISAPVTDSGCQGWCNAQGKGIAWIPVGRGLGPKTGDVFKKSAQKASNHVGVSYRVEGGTWWTVEGGQGSPAAKFDAVMMKNSNQLGASTGIVGWIDIELWAEAADKKYSVPNWIVGFWKVVYRQKQAYYYYFGPDHRAVYTTDPMQAPYLPSMAGTGRFAMTGAQSMTVLWFETGEIERYQPNPGVTDSMVGSWNSAPDELAAEKIPDIQDYIDSLGPFTPW